MKPLLLIFVALLTVTGIESCYVAKPLDHDVKISISNTADFPITITNTASSNFSGKYTEAEYRKYYVEELIKELTYNHLVIDDAAPEFTVKINGFEMHETSRTDTVKDTKSKDNGMIRDLTKSKCKTTGTVTKVATNVTGNWDADKDDEEKLTSNSNVGQIILGQNKESSPEWRENAFDENHFISQSAYCGRRAAVRITQEVKRLLP